MKATSMMLAERHAALIAGSLYFVIIFLGLTSELALRGPLIVPEDAGATALAIAEAPARLGLSILADTAMVVADVALALMLFILFRDVGAALAGVAALLRLIQAAVIASGLTQLWAAGYWAGVPGSEAATLGAMLTHAAGYDLGLIFFGVATIVMGVLVRRHDGFPNALGWLLGAAGVVYILGSVTRVLSPQVNEAMQPAYLIAVIAETGFALLLIRWGLSRQRADAMAAGV